MSSVVELWEKLRARRTIVPRFAEIDDSRILNPIGGVNPILPGRHYFAITVDELFLSHSRQWYREFDPMVLAITEFVHGAGSITLPFIVGPKLLGDSAELVPQGMLYRRTRVAGVHPFCGGRVISTIVFCQVRRRDYARQLLNVVESVAAAVPFAANVGTYAKYAGSLLDGVDALFGVGGTTPIVGVRQEFDHDLGKPIRPAYYVLVDGAEDRFPTARFWVRDGGLMRGDREDNLQEFRETSYVLFSVRGVAELSDLNSLPQYSTAQGIVKLAASADKADWQRAKAELVVLLRELLISPDLTRDQALQYHDGVVHQALEAHHRATSIGNLSIEADPVLRDDLRNVIKLLDIE